jgi:hypothetical protein
MLGNASNLPNPAMSEQEHQQRLLTSGGKAAFCKPKLVGLLHES